MMDLLAVLSAAGVPRTLVYAADRAGLPGRDGPLAEMGPEVADRALARLAAASLLTFSLDGSSVSVHRLVMRVIRDTATKATIARLKAVYPQLHLGTLRNIN